MGNDIAIPGVFLAGAVSFLTPCVLPLVPPYLAFIAGTTVEQLAGRSDRVARRAVLAAGIFVLGFATVFIALGAAASLIGALLLRHRETLAMVAGAAIIIMGLHFIGLFRIPLLYREARVEVARRPVGLWGAYVIGLAFGFGWTPCIGPVLASVLAVAASEATVARGAGLLAIYSLGLGVPFVLAAFAMRPFSALLARYRSKVVVVEKVLGAALVVTGVAFLTGTISEMSYWLLETFPSLQEIG